MNEAWFRKIDDYVAGRMDPPDRMKFEEEVASDQELSAILDVYKEVEASMRRTHSPRREALKNSLSKLGAAGTGQSRSTDISVELPGPDGLNKEVPGGRSLTHHPAAGYSGRAEKASWWRTPAIAAAALGIVLLGSLLWFFNNRQSRPPVAVDKNWVDTAGSNGTHKDAPFHNKEVPIIIKEDSQAIAEKENNSPKINSAKRRQLFAAYFKPDVLPATIPKLLAEPLQAYGAARHENAVEGLEDIRHDLDARGAGEDDPLVRFYIHYYKAQSYLATNNTSGAIAELNQAGKQRPDALSKTKINWYLGMAYLKAGNVVKAERLFRELARNSPDTAYKQRATKLLQELNP